ncbi:hypothetical protein A2961_02075 [Candidatus Woesebacteria bacterium RIFCSPLOWO2_01_FULL_39_21]|uniref:ATP-cone domain-containing protein n=1 Tax=Candidatus Woesebacteria bacterium RIFCSPLOWO2_01_FULL_39_21 TaxID=1802519 RepID=A0A1F8BGY2_9BACT|nr:MAG: hypothetical protein A2691_04295 [Candidatus Woesebacteria bacterium RIFCSPHIGHO2_01_FULL_39_23]OGM63314.1 MAG: hypothetical protein A2961_02075 [Candidatus Woesebacteria bacterium RIFCSPLOWO2_01_FULL_39_21]
MRKMEKKMVVKRDGTNEEFDRNKVFNSIVGATGTPEEAEKITSGIESWVNNSMEPIKTLDIRSRVAAALKGTNPTAAQLYETYEKPA